jgi:hypothetical protein
LSTKGVLALGEPHPASKEALAFIRSLPVTELLMYREVFASMELGGNRGAEICHETLRRLFVGAPVSDRYLLGLAWALHDLQKEH